MNDESTLDDAELRRAFAPRRAAARALGEKVIARWREERGDKVVGVVVAKPPAARWVQMLLAAAAGFLLAVGLFRPWQRREVVVQRAPLPIAQVALATGPIEIKQNATSAWAVCPSQAPLEAGCTLRTGDAAQCEVATRDGNSLRMNNGTELHFTNADTVQLTGGQVWADNFNTTKSLAIESANGTVIAEPNAKIDVACQGDKTLVTVLEGNAKIAGAEPQSAIAAGNKATLIDGKITSDQPTYDPLLETAWVNGLSALKDARDPELAARVKNMLSQVGAAKLSNLYEDELRRLGDAGVGPLIEFLESTRGDAAQTQRRATAMRIVADVAQPRWIPEFISLLTDPQAEVRAAAAGGLQRLTGRNQGLSAAQWAAGPWASCAPAHEHWLRWWAENRQRYPGAAETATAPAASW